MKRFKADMKIKMNKEFEVKTADLQKMFISENQHILKQYNKLRFESLQKDSVIMKLGKIVQKQEYIIEVTYINANRAINETMELFNKR